MNLEDSNTTFSVLDNDTVEVPVAPFNLDHGVNPEGVSEVSDSSEASNASSFNDDNKSSEYLRTSYQILLSNEDMPSCPLNDSIASTLEMQNWEAAKLDVCTLSKNRNQVTVNNVTVEDCRDKSSAVLLRAHSLKEKGNLQMIRKSHKTLPRAATENNLLSQDIIHDQSKLIHSTPQIPNENSKYPISDRQININSNLESNCEETSNQFELFRINRRIMSSEQDTAPVRQQSISDATNCFTALSVDPNNEVMDENTLKILSILQNVKQHEHDYEKKRDEFKDTLYESKLNYKKCGLAVGMGLTMATTVMASIGLPALAYCSEPIEAIETELSSQGLDINSMSSIDSDADTNSLKRQKNEASLKDDENIVHNELKIKAKRQTHTSTGLLEGLKVTYRQ